MKISSGLTSEEEDSVWRGFLLKEKKEIFLFLWPYFLHGPRKIYHLSFVVSTIWTACNAAQNILLKFDLLPSFWSCLSIVLVSGCHIVLKPPKMFQHCYILRYISFHMADYHSYEQIYLFFAGGNFWITSTFFIICSQYELLSCVQHNPSGDIALFGRLLVIGKFIVSPSSHKTHILPRFMLDFVVFVIYPTMLVIAPQGLWHPTWDHSWFSGKWNAAFYNEFQHLGPHCSSKWGAVIFSMWGKKKALMIRFHILSSQANHSSLGVPKFWVLNIHLLKKLLSAFISGSH